LSEAAGTAGRNDLGWDHVDALIADCARSSQQFSGLPQAGAGAGFRTSAGRRIARQPHRYSGRTAMNANVNVHEPKSPVDDESPFSFSMEGANQTAAGSLLTYAWSPGWNSNQSILKFQEEIGGPLRGGDPGVHLLDRGTTLPAMMKFQPTPKPAGVQGLHAIPVYEVFGSDELTAEATAIQQRTPAAYVLLNAADADSAGVGPGDGVRDPASGARFVVGVSDEVPVGHAYYASGLPDAWPVPPGDPVQLLADPDYQPPAGGDNLIARG
jgi:NADH-quinone oxidoreductase subunit G